MIPLPKSTFGMDVKVIVPYKLRNGIKRLYSQNFSPFIVKFKKLGFYCPFKTQLGFSQVMLQDLKNKKLFHFVNFKFAVKRIQYEICDLH